MKWPLFIRGRAFSFLIVSPFQVTLSPIWGGIVFLPRREREKNSILLRLQQSTPLARVLHLYIPIIEEVMEKG